MANQKDIPAATEKRLKRLEKKIARLRWACILFIFLFLGVLIWSKEFYGKSAEGFSPEDTNEAERVGLIETKEGAELRLYGNSDFGPLIKLAVVGNNSQLDFYDGLGNLRAALRMRGDEPRLVLLDKDENVRVWLGIDKKGPGLWLQNEEGEVTRIFK